ncbi:helix-turn-helix domain-containing protein [Nocardioides pacificus]
MLRRSVSTAFSALGIGPGPEHLYWQLLGAPRGDTGADLDDTAASVLRTREQLLADLEPLIDLGIARREGDSIRLLSPADAFATLVEAQAVATARVSEQLTRLARAIPLLDSSPAGTSPGTAGAPRIGDGQSEPIAGEVLQGGDMPSLVVSLMRQTQGELLWLRPDQWRMPHESAFAACVAEEIEAGRRSRAIYPARILQDAPRVLVSRSRMGEEIRVAAEVPTRLVVLGASYALVPETLGIVSERRLLIRQGGLVRGLAGLFELLWDRAATVPGLEHGEARPDLRRLLLQLLAEGAKDEQIARTLGLSLRTVRRRIAAILSDLGVDSRFQAGVEAVRRGWL